MPLLKLSRNLLLLCEGVALRRLLAREDVDKPASEKFQLFFYDFLLNLSFPLRAASVIHPQKYLEVFTFYLTLRQILREATVFLCCTRGIQVSDVGSPAAQGDLPLSCDLPSAFDVVVRVVSAFLLKNDLSHGLIGVSPFEQLPVGDSCLSELPRLIAWVASLKLVQMAPQLRDTGHFLG